MWYDVYMKLGKCVYCKEDAKYFDVVLNNDDYIVADVCEDHLEMGLSS